MRQPKTPKNCFSAWEFPDGGMSPLVPLHTPLMISIAIVSSIAILLFDTYRGRNFRYRLSLNHSLYLRVRVSDGVMVRVEPLAAAISRRRLHKP